MKAILNEAKNLINNEGNVWLWYTDSPEWFKRFSSIEDAQKFAALRNQNNLEHNIPASSYSIGSEEDFMAAAKKFKAEKKANEVQGYCQHVDKLIKRKQLEVKALDGLSQVCHQFDGKVLNKRFHDAVKAETGFSSSFDRYRYELTYYGREYDYYDSPNVSLRADWSHGKSQYSNLEWDWQWNTGERLEAQKAIVVIDNHKNECLKAIQGLKDSKKKYAAYIRLARQAEEIFKKMSVYHYELREYAKKHDLKQYGECRNLWLI